MARSLVAAAALASAAYLAAQQYPAGPQAPAPEPRTPPSQGADDRPDTVDRTPRTQPEASGRTNLGDASANRQRLARSDRKFLEEAAESGHKDVQISQAVLGKLTMPAARDFAQMMVNDHNAANAELQALAAKKGVALPEPNTRVINKWSDKTRNVDSDYVEEMEDDHKKAVDRFEKASRSEDPEIAAFAQKQLPKLREHLTRIQNQIKPAVER